MTQETKAHGPDRDECPECMGTGWIDAENCSSCEGTGKIIVHSHAHSHGAATHDHPHAHASPHHPDEQPPHDHGHE